MVAGGKRNAAFPDLPCAAEVGLPDYTVTTWYGVWAPKGTPADIQAKAADEIRKAINSPELKAIWASNGADFPDLSQQQSAAFVHDEVKRWSGVVKASGATLD
jgi:tripartite-type tricarboxylate transporter receptor subunit TctC